MQDSLKHRKSQASLTFRRPDGTPVRNARVKASHIRHQFLFGFGAFDAIDAASDMPGGEKRAFIEDRLRKMLAIFNYGTLPFYWGRFEKEEGKPETQSLLRGAKWLKERGVIPKGHPLCWHTVCAPWLMQYSNEVILEKQLARIRREVTDFKGVIDAWDVINEVVIMPVFDKYDNAVSRLAKQYGQVGLVKRVFDEAKAHNPGATLLLNDFNTSPAYERLIEQCLDAGVPVDVIGIQSHQHQGYWGKDKVLDVLERFSRFGLPLHFTENTLISGDLMPGHIDDLNDWQVKDWPSTPEGEERQEREVAEMYTLLFSHPLVEAITVWDAVDGKWLNAPSGLLRRDNSEKPAYHKLKELIRGDWATHTAMTTDENGQVRLDGFLGDYELTCQGNTVRFTLGKDTDEAVITIYPA